MTSQIGGDSWRTQRNRPAEGGGAKPAAACPANRGRRVASAATAGLARHHVCRGHAMDDAYSTLQEGRSRACARAASGDRPRRLWRPPPRLGRRPRGPVAPQHRRRRAVAVLAATAAVALIAGLVVGAVSSGSRVPAPPGAGGVQRLLPAHQDAGQRRRGVVRGRRAARGEPGDHPDALLHAVRPRRRVPAQGGGAHLRRRAGPLHAGHPARPRRASTCRRPSSRSGSRSATSTPPPRRSSLAATRSATTPRPIARCPSSRARPSRPSCSRTPPRSATTARRSRGCSGRRTGCGTTPRWPCCASTRC